MAETNIIAVGNFTQMRRPYEPRLYQPGVDAFWQDTDFGPELHVVGRKLAEETIPRPELTRKAYPSSDDLHPSFTAPWGDDPDDRAGTPGCHDEHIALIRQWFETPAVRRMEDGFSALADRLIAAIRAKGDRNGGRFDLANDFAGPFALGCAGQLIGLELAEADWRDKINVHVSAPFSDIPRQYDIDAEIWRLFGLRAVRRGDGDGGQLIDAVIDAVRDDRLDPRFVVPIVWMVLIAAESTTSANIVSMLGLLDEHGLTDQVRANLDDDRLLTRVVEESLRMGHVFDSTPPLRAVRDMRIGDFDVPKDTIVWVWYVSANRDAPNDDRFDITRQPNHIAFSTSRDPHVCLGAHMARRMMKLALTKLLGGLPHLRRDPEGSVRQVVGLNNSYLQADFVFAPEH